MGNEEKIYITDKNNLPIIYLQKDSHTSENKITENKNLGDDIPENNKNDEKIYIKNEDKTPIINLQKVSQTRENKITEDSEQLGDKIPENKKNEIKNYNANPWKRMRKNKK